MPYLEFKQGETKEIRIESDTAQKDFRHWIAGKPYLCTKPDCQYCRTGFPVRQRYVVDATYQGEPYKWVVTNTVHAALIAACGGGDNLSRHKFSVTRAGTGLRTEYNLVLLGSAQPIAGETKDDVVPPWEATESKQDATLVEMFEALRDIGVLLESLLDQIERHLHLPGTAAPEKKVSHGKTKGKASKE